MSVEGWKKVKLVDICIKIGSGATPTGGANAYKTSGISLIRSQNVLDFSFSLDGLAFIDDVQADKLKSVIIEEEDVLLNITGDSVARSCIVPNSILPARVNQHVSIVRVEKNKASNKFVFYYTQYIKPFLLSIASNGGTRNALTKTMIEQLDILLPSLSEQKTIAATLSALDDAIELNNQINKKLEEMAQAISKSWFVDFEPFKDGEFEESELGLIPKGWRVGTLGEICTSITKGTTPTTLKRSFVNDGINFIKAETITGNHAFDLLKLAYIDEETNKLLRRSIIQEGDILITIAGTIGRYAIVPKNILPANTNQAVGIIRVNKQSINPLYVLCYMLCNQHKEYIESHIVQAVQANLSLGIIKNLPIILPNDSVLNRFYNVIDPIFETIKHTNEENQIITVIRDTLLPKLMSGEIRVPVEEVEQLV